MYSQKYKFTIYNLNMSIYDDLYSSFDWTKAFDRVIIKSAVYIF